MSIRLSVVLFAITAVCSGCGFQLRGATPLSDELSPVYIQGGNTVLIDELVVYLVNETSSLTNVRDDANSILQLGLEYYHRRVLSVDPVTGKEREFELTYTVSFGMTKSDGAVVVEQQTVKVQRDYVFDPDAVIGKSREEGVLQVEMRRDAAQQIIRHIRAAIRG